jgi:hypothetical protein
MISYDSDQMHAQADKVKGWADGTLVFYTISGMLLGAGGGYGVTAGPGHDDSGLGLAVGVVVGGLLGFLTGYSYAFIIRIVMHIMLCLAQIERNTAGMRADAQQAGQSPKAPPKVLPGNDGAGTFLLTPVGDSTGANGVSRTGSR